MAENTNTEREALLELIDAYAEARHVGGCHTYNAKTAEARNAVIAKLAASAGSEPVAWVDERALSWLANSRSLSATITTQLEKGKSFERCMPLYLHPSPPEGMVGGWISVDERLPEPFEEVVVYPRPDDYCCEAFCDTAGKWKWAEYEHNFGVHHRECQVEYWLMLPEVPAPPTTSAGSGKGE